MIDKAIALAIIGVGAIAPGVSATPATAYAPTTTIVETFTDPTPGTIPALNAGPQAATGAQVLPVLTSSTVMPTNLPEDSPGFDCRFHGDHVCGVGFDPVFPHLPTVYGVPVNTLDGAHALSVVIGATLGVGSSAVVSFSPEEVAKLTAAAEVARAAAVEHDCDEYDICD